MCCTSNVSFHCERTQSRGRTDHDAHLESESAERFDAGRPVGDDVGGVPSTSGRRARHVLFLVLFLGVFLTRGTTTRAPRATTTPGAATPRLAEATTAAGMPAARPAIPAHTGTTSVGPATTRAASVGRTPGWASAPAWASAHRVWVWAGAGAASAGRRPGSGCGPAWAPAAWAEGADRPQVLRSPCSGARPGPTGVRSGRHCGGRMMGERPVTARPTTVEEARTPTGAAGHHSGGAPAALLHRKWKSSMPESAECLRRRASEGRPSRGVAGDGHRSGDPLRVALRLH